MRRRLLAFLISIVAVTVSFDLYGYEIEQLNAKIRVFVTTGKMGARVFDENGLPTSRNAKTRTDFMSPFYVVHYGLVYSETCATPKWRDRYHWVKDPTEVYWNVPPKIITKDRFRHAADWVVDNIQTDTNGNAHLFYDFDWAYKGLHPTGKLTAPWWSGLTDGHALTLLLRASDCFGSPAYEKEARALYESVLTPFSQGGSLVQLNGQPWIEEYADPTIPEQNLSRVFNGMVYAYHGVRAYEDLYGGQGMADALKRSIIENIDVFGQGPWSYYDAIDNSANIKYHRINMALVADQRLDQPPEILEALEKWQVGARHAGVLYVVYGPNSIAKWHFIATYILMIAMTSILLSIAIRKR